MQLLKRGEKMRRVKFGSVTLSASEPDEELVRRNIEQGQAAFARMARKLVRPGVSLKTRKNVPLFRADDDDPRWIIRSLNGKVERGKFEKGVFVAAVE